MKNVLELVRICDAADAAAKRQRRKIGPLDFGPAGRRIWNTAMDLLKVVCVEVDGVPVYSNTSDDDWEVALDLLRR